MTDSTSNLDLDNDLSKNDLSKKLPGRPKGSKNRAPKFRHYKPKKWKPVFDEIIIASAMGVSNTELADKYRFTPGHISNILCTDEADVLRATLRAGLKEKSKQTLEERLAALQEKALTRVEDYMNKDWVFDKTPTEAVDRAFKLLNGVKVLNEASNPTSSTTNVQNNTLVVNEDQFARLLQAGVKGEGIKLYDPSRKVDSSINVTNDK